MRTQISTNVSLSTRAQANELIEKRNYSMRDVVTIGIRMLHQEEFTMDWIVSFYYDNPKRNFKTQCKTRDEAISESLNRIDVVSYIENKRTGEWVKREKNSSKFDWVTP